MLAMETTSEMSGGDEPSSESTHARLEEFWKIRVEEFRRHMNAEREQLAADRALFNRVKRKFHRDMAKSRARLEKEVMVRNQQLTSVDPASTAQPPNQQSLASSARLLEFRNRNAGSNQTKSNVGETNNTGTRMHVST